MRARRLAEEVHLNEYETLIEAKAGIEHFLDALCSEKRLHCALGYLTATAASRTQINLAWRDIVSNEDGFKIERCRNKTCADFTQTATVRANVTSYQNTRLSSNTVHR